MAQYVDEFRGTDHLVYALVESDDSTGYATGEVKILAPVAEISKTVETASETKYYDNKPALTINAEGADTITLTVPALDLPTLADITGKTFDQSVGAFFDGETTPRYFALGYRLRLTDGTYRYVWRYKGSFAIPDETSATENAGTDTNNQQLTFTGIQTMYVFTKTGSSEKALVVDERSTEVDLSGFFDTVLTCDTFGGSAYATITNALNHITNNNSTHAVSVGGQYQAVLSAAEGYELGDVTIVMGGVDVTSSAYTDSTGAISISNVTGDIVIAGVATATESVAG